MPSLDTNVLIRWLVADDLAQTDRVRELFETARDTQDTLFVPTTVMLELEWVLRSRYQFDKTAAVQAFTALLETQELEFQGEPALERAIHLYRQGTAEFADCLHAGQCEAAERLPLLTFDAKAARLPDVRLLIT
jgi:predicted nucleic-acid-binding protein